MHYGMEVSEHFVIYGGDQPHTRIIPRAADFTEEAVCKYLSERLWVKPTGFSVCNLRNPDFLCPSEEWSCSESLDFDDGTVIPAMGCSLAQACGDGFLPLGGRPGVVLFLGAQACHAVPHDGHEPLSRNGFTILEGEINAIDLEARELTACLAGRIPGDLYMDDAGSYDWCLPAYCWEGSTRPAVSYTHYRQLVDSWKQHVCQSMQREVAELLLMAGSGKGHLMLVGPWAASLASTFSDLKFARVWTPKEPGLAIAKALYRRGICKDAEDRLPLQPGPAAGDNTR